MTARARDHNMGSLSVGMERALLICRRDGRLLFDGKVWIGELSRLQVQPQTVHALFDRHFLLVCYGGEKRRLRHSAKLTPTGILITNSLREHPRHRLDQLTERHAISEESAQFIAQVTA